VGHTKQKRCTIEGENLTLACRNATLNTMALLQERGFSREQAHAICSVAADLRVSNVVDVKFALDLADLGEIVQHGCDVSPCSATMTRSGRSRRCPVSRQSQIIAINSFAMQGDQRGDLSGSCHEQIYCRQMGLLTKASVAIGRRHAFVLPARTVRRAVGLRRGGVVAGSRRRA
jgi:hypothetical protein